MFPKACALCLLHAAYTAPRLVPRVFCVEVFIVPAKTLLAAQGRVLPHATLVWKTPADSGDVLSPHSNEFDDIFFSGKGPEETRHIFLDGNQLPTRFSQAGQMAIGELGFGTGLNFLCSWQLWDQTPKPETARLHFFSVEKFPLRSEDFIKAGAAWPVLQAYTDQLATVWPPATTGFHQLSFGDVTLTIYHGNADKGLKKLQTFSPRIDAWFLDGFSPSRNAEMWTPEIYESMAALSAPDATLSTFTVAGQIRRDLERAGFAVSRQEGYGKKRHMLTGTRKETNALKPDYVHQKTPWTDLSSLQAVRTGATIAIIGGGIAGASLCHAVRAQGLRPLLVEKNALASGASGNPAALIMPRLDRDISPTADFFVSAWLYTLRIIAQHQDQYRDLFDRCGIIRGDVEREVIAGLQQLAQGNLLPEEWIKSTQTGVLFPHAGIVNPKRLVEALAGDVEQILDRAIQIHSTKHGLFIEIGAGNMVSADAVVIANGMDSLKFQQARGLPLHGSIGQIDHYTHDYGKKPALAHGPYMAPAPNAGGTVLGATYEPLTKSTAIMPSIANRDKNLDAARRMDPQIAEALADAPCHSRAAVRCVTPDRLPVAGPLPDWAWYGAAYDGLRFGRRTIGSAPLPRAQYQPGIYILSGLGSRGIVTAPYCAAMIAAQLAGTVIPCEKSHYDVTHPGRFFIRTLKRAQTVKGARLRP